MASKDKMCQSNTMKEIPDAERPYEKCVKRGTSSLSDVELLAILLRTGIPGENVLELSERILYHSGENGILGIHQFTIEKLMGLRGIGQVKATQIVCISELAKRLAKASVSENLNFSSPASIAEYYMEDMRHEKQENIKLLMLNTKGKLVGENDISKGTVNASLITPREVFVEALRREAVGIVLIHNHPSGDPTPSSADLLLTKRIKDAGELIGIELLDHIIIGNNCYKSLNEDRLL